MALNFRQTEILELARAEGRVVVEDLAARFDVTLADDSPRPDATLPMPGIWTGCMAGRSCAPGSRTSATRRGGG